MEDETCAKFTESEKTQITNRYEMNFKISIEHKESNMKFKMGY